MPTIAADDKIRVTFVLPSFSGGGAERVVLTLARHLDRARFSPTLIVLNGAGELRDSVATDMPVIDLEQPRLRHAWRRLGAVLRATPSEVVIPTISHINLAVLMMRRRLHPATRIVVRESNTPSANLGATAWPGLYRWFYRRYCRRADAIMCPSEKIAAEFAAGFGIARDRLAVLPHPVDIDAIRRAAAPLVRASGGGGRFVAAGRMTRQKGFDRLIDLFAGLPDNAHLTLLGDGGDIDALRSRAARVGARIEFPGFVDNPWAHYAGADAFLLPSRWEGMPNAALEALAVGTPVIARAEAGGIGEVAAADGAVTIVQDNDAFADAMRRAAPGGSKVPRPSLLPRRFELGVAIADFEALLHSVTARPR